MDLQGIKQQIVSALVLQIEIEKKNVIYKELKKGIQTFFDEDPVAKKEKKIVVQGRNKDIIVKPIRRVSMNFLPEKLKGKLSKEKFNKVVEKKYVITDYIGVAELLKKYKVPPSEFKQFIDVEMTPKMEAIREMYSLGDLTVEELKDTYEVKISKFVKIETVGKEYDE